jgi:hypothetical protein
MTACAATGKLGLHINCSPKRLPLVNSRGGRHASITSHKSVASTQGTGMRQCCHEPEIFRISTTPKCEQPVQQAGAPVNSKERARKQMRSTSAKSGPQHWCQATVHVCRQCQCSHSSVNRAGTSQHLYKLLKDNSLHAGSTEVMILCMQVVQKS